MTAQNSTLRATVKEKYGQAALRVQAGETDASCCGSSACCGATTESWDPITSDLYDERQKAGIPAEAVLASLGCGNPTALAELKPGEVVLDLGSGGGIDVLRKCRYRAYKVYSIEDARGFLSGRGLDVDALVGEVEGKFLSAFIRASKPATGCCSPRPEPNGRRVTPA